MKINENKLYCFDKEQGDIIGVDEAGRGPLAGYVVAGAVYLIKYTEKLNEINDSKKLSEIKREKLFEIIKEHFQVGIGIATEKEIDEINILNATFLAMRRGLEELEKKNICISEKKILVDGNHNIREYNGNQQFVIKGDSKSLSIAAASIIAKVFRDRYMKEMSKKYPGYEFEKHKGYGTKRHREILIEKGPIEIHRKTFLKKILGV